jgi:hypothetical protein
MNGLPDPQREALILVGICGFSYEETALLLDGTLGTVKSRVARARISLLNILQSRRVRRTKLHPANSTAFDEWLVQLDQLRITACKILEAPLSEDRPKLTAVPKIPLRTNNNGNASPPRVVTEKPVVEDDAYAALGSPAPALAQEDLVTLQGLTDALSLAAVT